MVKTPFSTHRVGLGLLRVFYTTYPLCPGAKNPLGYKCEAVSHCSVSSPIPWIKSEVTNQRVFSEENPGRNKLKILLPILGVSCRQSQGMLYLDISDGSQGPHGTNFCSFWFYCNRIFCSLVIPKNTSQLQHVHLCFPDSSRACPFLCHQCHLVPVFVSIPETLQEESTEQPVLPLEHKHVLWALDARRLMKDPDCLGIWDNCSTWDSLANYLKILRKSIS